MIQTPPVCIFLLLFLKLPLLDVCGLLIVLLGFFCAPPPPPLTHSSTLRVDIIRVEAGGPSSVLLAGKNFVCLVMREAVSCSV
jgi:hypothetical protein